MAPRLPRLIPVWLTGTVLLTLSPALARAQETASRADPARRVITRDMIDAAGLMRLGEVMRLAAGWNAVTADEFTWRAAPRGFGAAVEDAWLVLVDGRPMDAAVLGVTSLERLPIDLSAIDSIVAVSSAVLDAGTLARRGQIHIHTHRPPEGLSARGRLAFGSETGDPGPFAFLPDGPANRDRYGHESAGELGLRRGRWYAAGSYSASVHLPTDPLILQRMDASAALSPRIERVAPTLRLGADGAGGGHHLIAGASRIDDWLRLELAALEVPVRSTLAHASAAGGLRLSGFDLRYRAGYERSQVDSRPEAVAPAFDVEWRTWSGSLEAVGPSARDRRIGLAFAHRSVRRAGEAPLDGELEVAAFAAMAWRPAASLRQHAAILVSGRGAGAEGGVIVTHELGTGAGDFFLRLTGTRGRAATGMGLLELSARGDAWLETAAAPGQLPAIDDMSREASVELGWTRREGGAVGLAASVFLRALDGFLPLSRNLEWDATLRAWRGPAAVEPASGRLAGGHIGARYRATRALHATAEYHLAAPFGGPRFRRASEPVPRHQARAAIGWRPVAGFGLGAALELESERRWPDHLAVAPSPGKARGAMRGGATASLTGWKTFHDGRLRAQFVARNLTNRRVILHPEGGARGLAFLLLLGAAL